MSSLLSLMNPMLHLLSTTVGVLDRGVLNQPVKVNCVPLIIDGDAKETQGLYWFRQLVPYVQSERSILYSLAPKCL